jgi:endonuclease I
LSRQRRTRLAVFLFLAVLGRFALATDVDYFEPAGYYASASGTGATLKSQLYTITSTGFVGRSYGDARFAFETMDKDPNNANNILLVYNRASVDGTWDGGITYNREHVWPKHWLNLTSSQVSNTYTGVASDLFELRPAAQNINSARGDLGYGTTSVTVPHTYGSVSDASGSYWYPGDADRGDVARTIFYMATRYGQGQANNLSVVNGQPATYQFGDLASLLKWNYEDTPDDFERRRNQAIYSSTLNPTYYQGNRNPYIDHPEWVWSVYVNQANDSQISIGSSAVAADGSSAKTVALASVIVGAAVPAAQSVTLSKAGNNGTYYSVTTAGAATSTVSGRFNAFRTNQTDSKSISVGLNTNTATAGLRSGTVTVDNLDITAGGGAGHGANDANDVITVNMNVLDHAAPSFASPAITTSLSHDFGNIALGDTAPTFDFGVFNLSTTPGFTAGLDLDNIASSGTTAAFTTDLTSFSTLAAGSSHPFTSSLNLTSVGTFSATYMLNLSDENIAGATNKTMSLTLTGTVRLAGDYNGDGSVDGGDYLVWRTNYGQSASAFGGADGDGDTIIDDADYDVWRLHFGQTAAGFAAGTSLTSAAVPEPLSMLLVLCAAIGLGLTRRR